MGPALRGAAYRGAAYRGDGSLEGFGHSMTDLRLNERWQLTAAFERLAKGRPMSCGDRSYGKIPVGREMRDSTLLEFSGY